MALTKVSPSLFATSNNITSVTVGGSANTISLTFDASGIITGASNNALLVSKTSLPAGTVLQVINASVNYATTTSSSYTDTGLTASITPNSVSNKILVTVCLNGITQTGSGAYGFALTDGSNNVLQNLLNYAAPLQMLSWNVSILLSPATTSSYTYKVRFYSNGSTTLRLNDYNANNPSSYITLMEIAA